MKAILFKPAHLEEINEWNNSWKLSLVSLSDLPRVGYIVRGAAAGFLYQTDSNVCFLEGFISNKYCEKGLRKEALDLISDELVKAAVNFGFKKIVAKTRLKAIAERCENYAFQDKGIFAVYLKEV